MVRKVIGRVQKVKQEKSSGEGIKGSRRVNATTLLLYLRIFLPTELKRANEKLG